MIRSVLRTTLASCILFAAPLLCRAAALDFSAAVTDTRYYFPDTRYMVTV